MCELPAAYGRTVQWQGSFWGESQGEIGEVMQSYGLFGSTNCLQVKKWLYTGNFLSSIYAQVFRIFVLQVTLTYK